MSKLSLVPRSAAPRFGSRWIERLFAADPRRVMIGASACFVAVAVLDINTPAQLNLTFAYVSILMVMCWHAGPARALGFAAVAFTLQVIGFELLGEVPTSAFYSSVILWNRLFTFLVVVALVAALRGLYERLQRSTANLRAMSQHLVRMQEVERHRLSNELHDCAGQPLAGLGISLDIACAELPASAPEALRTRLAYCKTCVDDMVDWMRGALEELRPTMLDSLGLAPALQKLARDLPRLAMLPATVAIEGNVRPIGRDLELAMFRIAQESLLNAGRHSGAREARVTLQYGRVSIRLTVEDRGRGFDPLEDRRAQPRGFGLLVMQERATAAGAVLVVESTPGKGTRVTAEAAIEDEAFAEAA